MGVSKQNMKSDPLNEMKPTKRKKITKTSQSGLDSGWTRATFIIQEDLLDGIKDLAYTERKKIKTVMQEALEAHLKMKSKTVEILKRSEEYS